MRFCHITDLHLADKSFGNHKSFVQEELWDQLEEVAFICTQEQRDLIITGDLFEHPRPSHVSHELVSRLVSYFRDLQDYGINTYLIAGNHDLAPDCLNSLNKQPIGVIANSGNVEFYMLPNVSQEGIQITPIHYSSAAESDPEVFKTFKRQPGVKFNIVLAHAMLVPDKMDTLPYPHMTHSQVADNSIDLVLYGHHHDYHGIHNIGNTTFANLGSFCRRSRNQQRDVYALLGEWTETSGLQLEERKLKTASPWEDLFHVTLDEVTVEEFGHDLAKQLLAMGGAEPIIDFREVLNTLAFKQHYHQEVLKTAYDYLENAEHRIYG